MSKVDPDRPAVVEINVGDVNSVHELHQRLANKLGFPDFYGHNWAAFWDVITGLVLMPQRLIVVGWSNVATRWPKEAEKMMKCLHELNDQYPAWGCQVELRPSEDPSTS